MRTDNVDKAAQSLLGHFDAWDLVLAIVRFRMSISTENKAMAIQTIRVNTHDTLRIQTEDGRTVELKVADIVPAAPAPKAAPAVTTSEK